ncbi:MAG: aminotransferase class IV [Planctomycetota bacterium]|nr:aminotransferase class IV [Planctomycetota bacterium]
MTHAVYCDGDYLVGDVPVFGAFSPATRSGVGVFESFAGSVGGVPTLARHVDRLQWAAGRCGALPLPATDFDAVFRELHNRAGLARARCRITLYPSEVRPRLVCTVEPLPEPLADIALCTSPFRRGVNDPTSALKLESRAFYEVAVADARARGGDDALLVGDDGEVRETTRANVFLQHDSGSVHTPTLTDHFLAGITRAVLLEALRGRGHSVRERTVGRDELFDASAVFVTNAVQGVVPVRELDGRPLRRLARDEVWTDLLP